MAGIQWAADLVDGLRATGTGQAKLDLVGRAMADLFDAPEHAHKPDAHPDRHLTAHEAVAVLQRAGAGEVTLEKCRQLLLTGVYAPPAERVTPADRLPKPPRATAAPVRAIEAPDEPRVQQVATDFALDDSAVIGPKPVAQEEAATDLARAGEKPEPKKPGGKKGKKAAAKRDEPPATEPAASVEAEQPEVTSDADGSGLPDAGEGPGGPAAE